MNSDRSPIDKILDRMEKRAQKHGVSGVAAVLSIADFNVTRFKIVVRIVGDEQECNPDPVRGSNGSDINHLAVALSKIAEMVSTQKDSGKAARPAKTGELGYRGGLIGIWDGGFILSAFSGGTAYQDSLIASAATQRPE